MKTEGRTWREIGGARLFGLDFGTEFCPDHELVSWVFSFSCFVSLFLAAEIEFSWFFGFSEVWSLRSWMVGGGRNGMIVKDHRRKSRPAVRFKFNAYSFFHY